uniref:SWIM-type domain-containing protein n=1 Tax=Haemonchus contortus TaxID=6289 RepID=A0A7I4Z4N5_HAECO
MSIVPFRDTCLYSWECSCLDNRSGVSCIHRHAVQIFGRGLTTSCTAESKESEESIPEFQLSRNDLYSREENLPAAAPGVQEIATSAQLRKEQRYRKLNEIMSTYAAFEFKAKALARANADDSLNKERLEEVLRYLKLASILATHQPSTIPAPQPELAKK